MSKNIDKLFYGKRKCCCKKNVMCTIAIIGGIIAMGCIIYAIYKRVTQDAIDDFEDDFDDDSEDEFEFGGSSSEEK